MSATSATEVPFLDLKDPAFSLQSPEARAARDASWYARTPYGIAVLRYAEASKLLKHRQLRQGSWAWPAHNGVTSGTFHEFWKTTLINYEGPDHARLRRLHNPAFSPKLIAGLQPRFQAIATELIDAFVERGECDFVAEFAEPYAARIICLLLGLPDEEWKTIAEWSAIIGLALGVTIKQDLPRIEKAMDELYAYADEVIAARRATPQDDFITKLVNSERNDEALTEMELRTAIVNAVFAGMDTTRNQIALAVATFARHPEQWELLAADPSLGQAAVEEVMRVAPTVTWVTREAIETFEYEGVEISQGTTVHLLTEVAGTDPLAGAGDEFDITKDRPTHFGFGGGMHHCLGHFVARSDMSEALSLLASRLQDIAIAPGDEWLPNSGNTGPIRLPLTFAPRDVR
jgi:cytochrome P450